MLGFCAEGRRFDPQPGQKVIRTFSLFTCYNNLNEQQTDPDPTTPMRRRIRRENVVMQYNDADSFPMTWLI